MIPYFHILIFLSIIERQTLSERLTLFLFLGGRLCEDECLLDLGVDATG